MKEKFIEIYNENIKRPGAEKLLEYLKSTDFFTAPASTRFHLSREGGLVEHSINVYERLLGICQDEARRTPDFAMPSLETIAICGLLHDVCKVNYYVMESKNRKTYDPEKVNAAEPWQVKEDAIGKFIRETVQGYNVDDKLPYGHGEKSVYIISGYMHLSRQEAMAIRFHMGFADSSFQGGDRSVGNAFDKYPLVVLTHVADLLASHIDEVGTDE